jgi:hypothetical protein
MRKFLIFLILISFVASVSAVPPLSGGSQGIHVRNLWVDGNAITAGTSTAGIAITSTGSIGADITMAANKDIRYAAGNGLFDASVGTGVFKTTTGDNTISGDLYMAAGKDIRGVSGASLFDMSMCSGAFLTPTGAVTIGPGAVGISGALTITELAAITAGSGSAAYDLSASTGAFTTSTGTNTLSGNTVITGAKKLTTGTGVTKNLGVFSAYLASYLNETYVAGLMTAGAGINTPTNVAANVGGALSTKTLTVNTTSTFTGLPTFNAGLTVASAQTLAVTTADKLTVGGTIIGTMKSIQWSVDNRTTVNEYIFTAQNGENWQVTGVSFVSRHASTGAASSMSLEKVHSGDALGASINVTTSAIDLAGAADTVVSRSISGTALTCKVNATDSLGIHLTATPIDLQGGCLTVNLKRVA